MWLIVYWFNSILTFAFGVGFGVITAIPNAMISDSGSKTGVNAAQIGLLASLSFVLGGVAGGFLPWQIEGVGIFTPYVFLVPGIVLQVLALAMFSRKN